MKKKTVMLVTTTIAKMMAMSMVAKMMVPKMATKRFKWAKKKESRQGGLPVVAVV